MIDYIMGIFLILFGFGFGILLGWVLSLPKDDDIQFALKTEHALTEYENKNFSKMNSSAYYDRDDWNECMKDCIAYGYNEPKKKRTKKKKIGIILGHKQ